jgi:HD-GYP domain-containing protein (c-di-GMP phosphodiesterase class II)
MANAITTAAAQVLVTGRPPASDYTRRVTADPAPGVLAARLEELNRVAAALSAERDTARLLDLILTKAREITCSDAASLYIVEPAEEGETVEYEAPELQLRFMIAQNDSVDVPFRGDAIEMSHRSIAGYVAQTGATVSIDDAYAIPPDAPYVFNRTFDEEAGYVTRSVLAKPLRTPQGRIIGVLQLINAKTDALARIDSPAAAAAHVIAYTPALDALATSLAGLAAVALENSQLWHEIHGLFEGFVRASVIAIEARDPITSGHSFRVANLTVALAEVVDRTEVGPMAWVRFSREDFRTIRYASLLHDFGKVGVREEVLVKAKKLHPAQRERIGDRLKLARRGRELDSMRRRLAYALEHGRDAYLAQAPAFDDALTAELGTLDEVRATVDEAMEPTIVVEGAFDRLDAIAAMTFQDCDGTTRPLLEADEVRLLSLRKGSLSDDERREIEAHVVHSYRFLTQIPWTREIRRIPLIALGHHEKLNGTGYPYKLSAPEIPVQTRMMTIADIFDALAAVDRPYKKAVPIDRALDILQAAVTDGELDDVLFDLFVRAKVYEKWKVEPERY